MIATHFPPQGLASTHVRYRSHALICASRDYRLGTRLDVEYRRVTWSAVDGTRHHHRRRVRRYVLRGVLVADVCGLAGRIDLPEGLYRSFLTSRGADDGRATVRVIGIHRGRAHVHRQRRHRT